MTSEITITCLDDWHLNVPADGTKARVRSFVGTGVRAKGSQHEAIANVLKEVQNRKITSSVIATAPAYRWRSWHA